MKAKPQYRVRPNQELFALGVANVVGSFTQSYPTTGGLSRTAIAMAVRRVLRNAVCCRSAGQSSLIQRALYAIRVRCGQLGGKSTLTTVFAVCLICITLLFFTPLLYYLPQTILASIVMVAVSNLIDPEEAVVRAMVATLRYTTLH